MLPERRLAPFIPDTYAPLRYWLLFRHAKTRTARNRVRHHAGSRYRITRVFDFQSYLSAALNSQMKAQPIDSLEDSCAFANVFGQEKRDIGRSNLTTFSRGVTIDHAVDEDRRCGRRHASRAFADIAG